jgi:NCS1 family nucleobase:cation symporter-1
LTRTIGFFIRATVFYAMNLLFPVHDLDQMDEVELYDTFTEAEARRLGVVPL